MSGSILIHSTGESVSKVALRSMSTSSPVINGIFFFLFRLLFEWQGNSWWLVVSSTCTVCEKEPSNSCMQTIKGPCLTIQIHTHKTEDNPIKLVLSLSSVQHLTFKCWKIMDNNFVAAWTSFRLYSFIINHKLKFVLKVMWCWVHVLDSCYKIKKHFLTSSNHS